MNLTSPATDLRFNPTSEILATASNYAERGGILLYVYEDVCVRGGGMIYLCMVL